MKRSGFTLIELLVAISIMAVLIALSVSASMRVRRTATVLQARTDVATLAFGANIFRGSYGVPPVVNGGGPGGTFRFCSSYLDSSGRPLKEVIGGIEYPWPEIVFLTTVFPSMDLADNGLRVNGAAVPPSGPLLLDGNRALVTWLSGGPHCGFQGFSNNPAKPFTAPAAAENRKRFVEIDLGRVRNPDTGEIDGVYRDRWGTPVSVNGFEPYMKRYAGSQAVPPYKTAAGGLYDPRGVQVVSAGPDRKFGPGGVHTPGQGSWASGQPGFDDIGSFAQKDLGIGD